MTKIDTRAELRSVLADLRDAGVEMTMSVTLLQRLVANRDERCAVRNGLQERASQILEASEARWAALPEDQRGAASLTAEEDAEYRAIGARLEPLREEIRQIDEELPALREEAARDQMADVARSQLAVLSGSSSTNIRVKSEPTTYGKGMGQSWLRDLAQNTKPGGEFNQGIRDRLQRHAKEIEVLTAEASPELRALTRTDGAGGEFVPPLWLMAEYIPVLRAGRVTAELCRKFALPAGTDTINLPKISTGTVVAVQAEGGIVSNTDATTTSVSAGVKTIAGQQKISMQLLEQSPLAFDEILFMDLLADYSMKLDRQVLFGANSATEVMGITNVPSLNATTYTDATSTLPEMYPKIAKIITDVATNRLLGAQAIVMHPRRWGWMLGQLDTTNRPLIVPNAQGPMNAFAGFSDVRAEGSVGSILGLPVYVDPNIPTNLGAGTNEDQIICCRFDDLYLFEGNVRTRTLFETDADTLQVRFQLYNYVAFLPNRYAQSISVLGGTGLNAVL